MGIDDPSVLRVPAPYSVYTESVCILALCVKDGFKRTKEELAVGAQMAVFVELHSEQSFFDAFRAVCRAARSQQLVQVGPHFLAVSPHCCCLLW